MEVGEAVTAFELMTEDKAENFCEGKKHDPPQTGPNLIDGLTGTPTPARLLANMEKHNERDGEPHIPKLPPKKAIGSESYWDIDECDSDTFPWQTHHIIPKKFLPKQNVCVWLTEKYAKHPDYQLEKDTRYSTDHANNGYCLPFASSSYQWKMAKKRPAAEKDEAKKEAAFLMMTKTGKQLHQGNHNKQEGAEFEEDEEIQLEKYLDSIERLLKRIFSAVFLHTEHCDECKSSGKKKIQPLHKTVDQVDQVSLIIKLKIDANEVFVSQKAYDYYEYQKPATQKKKKAKT